MIYCIQATRTTTTTDGYTRTTQIPTFYLHGAVQGIVSEQHAESIARDMLAGDGVLHVAAFNIGEFF